MKPMYENCPKCASTNIIKTPACIECKDCKFEWNPVEIQMSAFAHQLEDITEQLSLTNRALIEVEKYIQNIHDATLEDLQKFSRNIEYLNKVVEKIAAKQTEEKL